MDVIDEINCKFCFEKDGAGVEVSEWREWGTVWAFDWGGR